VTKVIYKKKDNFFEFITVYGHSEFSTKGKDIVCAGISSIVEGSCSFLSSYYNEFIIIKKKEGKISFTPLKNDLEINICLEMMFYQLKNIERFYPNYLAFLEEKRS
jgi:uncharacterized protein